ncbi:MAG: Lactoylglutathione lyase [Alphaproteobacteria bacterium MarineAlpha9_Bin2]|nr:MAG: Lactoylglutathione lyase [Alphaproteobacteria bacterium MarineAlpha9_Bin2]
MGSNNFKYLHTMMRVNDLDESINFYSKMFGMQLLRKSDYPDGKFTLAFLGYGDEENNTVLELTYNWDQKEKYKLGNAWGHIAIGVENIYDFCEELEKNNIVITRKPGPMKHGNTVIAFLEDPNGYQIELIQK